jgi:hypothetical protein
VDDGRAVSDLNKYLLHHLILNQKKLTDNRLKFMKRVNRIKIPSLKSCLNAIEDGGVVASAAKYIIDNFYTSGAPYYRK